MERAPAVVAVVVTTGPGPGLEATLASLVAQDYPELSVIVVANGEHEGVAARVAAVAPQAFVRTLDVNAGFGAACNEAATRTEGAGFWLFCHDDVRLDPDCTSRLVEAAYRTNAGIVTPKVVAYDDALVLLHVGQNADRFGVIRERVEDGEIDHGQRDLERDVFVAPGGVTLVRADLFTQLRGFDPLITMMGEDLDLSWRAQLAGARIVVAPTARVAHRESTARGERAVTAVGTRRASLQDLQRRHQLLVVATGWGRVRSLTTVAMLLVLDGVELLLALALRDADRAGAIVGSWRWVWRQRRRVIAKRNESEIIRVFSDDQLHALQVGGAQRLKDFADTALREGLDTWRTVVPEHVPTQDEAGGEEFFGPHIAGAFSEDEEFDELDMTVAPRRPSRLLTSFRAQAALVVSVAVLWLIGSRNLVAMHLPSVGRLTPLDSWWSNWRHFFASWSPNGLGTGTPAPPGYGALAVAGTFVFGRMGILPRLALMACVPIGAFGMNRFLRDRVSNRARLAGTLSYIVAPIGLNMISQGRIDVLVAVALMPFLLRRLLEILDIAGFRRRPFGDPVPFGHRGWRSTQDGQRTLFVMLTSIVTFFAPAVLVALLVVAIGVSVTRRVVGEESWRPWRTVGSLLAGVAIFTAPLTVDTLLAGRRALSVFGLPRGPWSTPSWWSLVRGADGNFGLGWTGWLVPLAAVAAVALARHERGRMTTLLATTAGLSLVLVGLVSRAWLGPFAPDIDVLLVLVAVCLSALIGYGVSAVELDLADMDFGWRQITAGGLVLTVSLLVLPLVSSATTGRFGLPTVSTAESLAALAPGGTDGYRVLWLGDPSVLPMPGWSVAPGLAAATSVNGLPTGDTLFSPPNSGAMDSVLGDVATALAGRTIRLGSLLAPAGISSVVVLRSASPELMDITTMPTRSEPASVSAAFAHQNDLALSLSTPSALVYSNVAFRGLIHFQRETSTQRILNDVGSRGRLTGPGVVHAAFAPAGAFALTLNGQPATRHIVNGFPQYVIPARTAMAQFEMHQFPLNGVLAAFVLALWLIVWMGFGVVEQLEVLFTRVPRRRRD